MTASDMNHVKFLGLVAAEDVRHLLMKERTYGGSWKQRGGVGAFMMLARKWDRLESMVRDAKWDVFDLITTQQGSGDDGMVLAEIRDLRRYLLLVESEMAARGVSGVESRDIYQLMADMMGTSRTIAKRDIHKTVYSAESYVSGTPEDGGHHERQSEMELVQEANGKGQDQ